MSRFATLLLLALATPAWAAINGTIVSSSGEPAADVRVTAYRAETASAQRARIAGGAVRPSLASATTDAKGAFTLNPKADGVFELRVESDRFAPAMQYAVAGDSEISIALDPAESRRGRVTAAGKNVAGAIVVFAAKADGLWSVRTDDEGAFAIADPKKWAASITVLHPDFAMLEVAVSRMTPELALLPGTAVSGKVVAAGGRPAAGAHILINDWPAGSSGDDGAFVLRHVAAGTKKLAAIAGTQFGSAALAPNTAIQLSEGRVINGSVRDANKRALAGVPVHAWARREWQPSEAAVTDDKGNFRIERLDPGMYQVGAQGPADFDFTMVTANVQTNPSARADITAETKSWLRGIVVDERKQPVTGAIVQYLPAQIPVMYAKVIESVMPFARSGGDGRFKLPDPGANFAEMHLRVLALHPRYAATVTELESTRRQLTLTLHDGIELRGTVSGSDGKPVAGAGVAAIQDPFGGAVLPIDSYLALNGGALIESGADGTFTIHLNAAPHDLTVWKEGFASFRGGGVTPVAGQEPLKIVLERGAEIRGRVVAKGSTKSLEGTIQAEGEDGSMPMGIVDSDGTFVLGSLRAGRYELEYSGSRRTARKEVSAPATDVVLELAAQGEVRGRVVDKVSGHPITDYSIVIEGADYRSEESDGDETFTIAVDPGPVKLTVRAPGYRPESAFPTVTIDKPATATFALLRGRTISGRVTSDTGAPLAQAAIGVEDESSYGDRIETADDGEFQLTGMPNDALTLTVQRAGYVTRSVAIDAGDADPHVTVALSTGRHASGRVVTERGEPVAKAWVWANPLTHDGAMQNTYTQADGTFTMDGLTEGRYSFEARRQDLGTGEVNDVDPAAAPIVIALKAPGPTGTIHGTVRGLGDRWMYGQVIANDGLQGLIGRDGKYRIENIPAGEVRVRAHAMSARDRVSSPSVQTTVAAGADVEVNLAFNTDITLRGTVTEGGQPAAGRRISFHSNAGGSWETRSVEGGAYEITGLEPGLYTVGVEMPKRQFQTQVQVAGSTTFDIAISFASVEGRVIDGSGAPMPGVQVEVANTQHGSSGTNATTDGNGAFSVSVQNADAFVVSAVKKGFATAVQRVERGAGPLLLQLVRSDGLRVRLTDARSGTTLTGYVVAVDANGLQVGKTDESQRDGAMLVPLAAGAYRVSVSANGFASQSRRATVPLDGELRFALTPGGTLIVNTDRASSELVKLIQPNGEEYVRCHCNGIAEVRLTGTTTTIEHVAPGAYAMQVLDSRGRIVTSYPVTIAEGQTATATIHVPE